MTTRTPVETPDQTHVEALAHLRELQRLPDRLAAQGIDATTRSAAARICAFFGDKARKHHADEERYVFPPLLRSADADLIQQVQRLQQDHGWLEEDWLELSAPLQAMADGYGSYEIDTLRRGIDVFAALLREHIALEESVIDPDARRLLDDARAAGGGPRSGVTGR